jgi:hypothetical protein
VLELEVASVPAPLVPVEDPPLVPTDPPLVPTDPPLVPTDPPLVPVVFALSGSHTPSTLLQRSEPQQPS